MMGVLAGNFTSPKGKTDVGPVSSDSSIAGFWVPNLVHASNGIGTAICGKNSSKVGLFL